jgi:hypothetical protein
MKNILKVIQVVLYIVMASSLFFLAGRLNFSSSNDKEPIYWIFFFIVLIYVAVTSLVMWKSYKIPSVKYRNVSIFLSVLYITFLVYLYS